jgi:hypothetical protein
MKRPITPTDLEDRFEGAARTLRRLPNPPGSTPRRYRSAWPEYAQDPVESYGYNEARVRVVPSPGDIQQMEECFVWLSWLAPDDRRIVWLRAEGRHWRTIGNRIGCVRQTAWRRWVAALATIAKQLNNKNKNGLARATAKMRADEHVVKPAKDVVKTLL